MAGPSLRLDRSRDYATVHGDTPVAIFAMQDGLPFGPDEELVTSILTEEQKAIVERRLSKMKPKPKKDAGSDQAEAGGLLDVTGDAINFVSWLKGLQRYPLKNLFEEARRRWSKNFTTVNDLIEFLVFDQQVASLDEVSQEVLSRGDAP